MSVIRVKSSSDIQGVIDQLKQFNVEFRKKADDINAEHGQLITKWEGDASTEFEKHFKQEYGNFETFAMAIDEYVAGLTQILQEYERAEELNKSIAAE
ncbi:MAG: WXG100 family type VII secretion target [Butyrivibrio sp.]|nr:WXG100 family type VII secretion target [Butyrivibrio sp.]